MHGIKMDIHRFSNLPVYILQYRTAWTEPPLLARPAGHVRTGPAPAPGIERGSIGRGPGMALALGRESEGGNRRVLAPKIEKEGVEAEAEVRIASTSTITVTNTTSTIVVAEVQSVERMQNIIERRPLLPLRLQKTYSKDSSRSCLRCEKKFEACLRLWMPASQLQWMV